MVQDDLEKIWKRFGKDYEKITKRLRQFRFSPQRGVSATRSADRELRPFARLPRGFCDGVQTKQWGRPSKVALRAELRCARVTSMPRVRARATPNARGSARSDALLPHSHSLWLRAASAGSHEPPPPSRFVPQAGPSLSPPARSRRRLARSRPRPASSRRRLAPRGAYSPLAPCRCRLPVLALDSARQAVSGAGIEPSHSSNHSAAGPSPAGVAGGPGGRQPPG